MKFRLPVLLLFLIIVYCLWPQIVISQEPTTPTLVFDFNRAYNDYVYTYNQYRNAHAEYVSAKQAYLNYKTLTSKNEAFEKTAKMLELRDNVIITYLTTIRMKLAETTGVSNYDQNILYLKLDDEVQWFSEHLNLLSSAGSLEDLVDSAKKSQDRSVKTEILIYQTLGTILAGKETSLREEISLQIASLKNKLNEIRQKGDKSTDLLDRWLLESENRLARSQEKQNASQQLLVSLKTSDRDKSRIYNQAQSLLEESHQYLKEANSYLKEFISEVKRAD